MKKIIFIFSILAASIAGLLLNACSTSAEKADNAQVKLQDAKTELQTAQQDANAAELTAARAAEWQTFKGASEASIKGNETMIADLKAKMKSTGKKLDAAYEKSIAELEEKNNKLKSRMDDYDKGQSDWESFKSEFKHDMDEIGAALKDLTVNNKK